MATIKEIADKAGVSPGAVSRVLNHDHTLSLSDDKRKLIFEISDELDYKTPRKRNEKNITDKKIKILLIHWYTVKLELEDPYYISIRVGIEQSCIENNIEIFKVYDPENYDFSKIKKIDGVIAIGKFSNKLIDKFANISKNIVFVDSSPREELYDSVVIDFEKAVINVLKKIIQSGHRHIGYIGGREYVGSEKRPLGEGRELTFRKYLDKLGILDEKQIYIGSFLAESGYKLMGDAIKKSGANLPSAFVIASDSMAVGAIRALHEYGIKIPKDISLVGFNDIPTSKYTNPPLSTVRVHKEFMGETAVELLLERIIKKRDIPKKVIVPTCLIIRSSVDVKNK